MFDKRHDDVFKLITRFAIVGGVSSIIVTLYLVYWLITNAQIVIK